MSKLHFFADLDVLNCLLGMNYDRSARPAMDLTMDVVEIPFWFSLKNEGKTRSLTLYTQMELYTKDEKTSVTKGSVVLDDASGNAKVSAPKGLAENMAAFYVACLNLSFFAREKGLVQLWANADPEQTGILLSAANGSLRWKRVSGKERPELTVERMLGGTIKMRPYMDDFWDRSETEMMPLEGRIRKAESGDKFAIAKLATAYLNGDDEVKQDPEKAAYWYRKEAELNDSEGAFNLGLLYAKGFGVERDFTKAAEWMEKAVEWGDEDGRAPAKHYRKMAEARRKAMEGDADAMAELAEGYMAIAGSLNQAGPDKDYAESLKWARKAADEGSDSGYWVMALAYDHGRGVGRDERRATELYRKGAELGNAACQHAYACRLVKGESGAEKDVKHALALFKKSAGQGYRLAYRSLGYMYETGEGVEPDFDRELEYFEKACLAAPNDAELLRHVGFQYTNLLDGDEEHWLRGLERAVYWLHKAADLGDRVAANGVGMYDRILESYRQGKIPAGTSAEDCMAYVTDGTIPQRAAPKQTGNLRRDSETARKEAERRRTMEARRQEEAARAAIREGRSVKEAVAAVTKENAVPEEKAEEAAQHGAEAPTSPPGSPPDEEKARKEAERRRTMEARRQEEAARAAIREGRSVKEAVAAVTRDSAVPEEKPEKPTPEKMPKADEPPHAGKASSAVNTPSDEEKARKEAERRRTMEARRQEEARRAEMKAGHKTEQTRLLDRQTETENPESRKREILAARDRELTRIMEKKKAEREEEIRKRYDTARRDAEDRLADAESRIAKARDRISELGLFDFSEKNRLKNSLEAAIHDKAAAEKALSDAEAERRAEEQSLQGYLSEAERKQRQEIERRFPMPLQTNSGNTSGRTTTQTVFADYKEDILGWMEKEKKYSIEDICGAPSLAASRVSEDRVRMIMRQLWQEGRVTRTEVMHRVYYHRN